MWMDIYQITQRFSNGIICRVNLCLLKWLAFQREYVGNNQGSIPKENNSLYSVFQWFRQAKFSYRCWILSSSQFLLLPQGLLKTTLTIKVVKIDSKIILIYWSKSVKQIAVKSRINNKWLLCLNQNGKFFVTYQNNHEWQQFIWHKRSTLKYVTFFQQFFTALRCRMIQKLESINFICAECQLYCEILVEYSLYVL
jgi:hypothetical protein